MVSSLDEVEETGVVVTISVVVTSTVVGSSSPVGVKLFSINLEYSQQLLVKPT